MHPADRDDVDEARSAHGGVQRVVEIVFRPVPGEQGFHQRRHVVGKAAERLFLDDAGQLLREIQQSGGFCPPRDGVLRRGVAPQVDAAAEIVVAVDAVLLPGAEQFQRHFHDVAGPQLAEAAVVVVEQHPDMGNLRVDAAGLDAGIVRIEVGIAGDHHRDRALFAGEGFRGADGQGSVAPGPREARRGAQKRKADGRRCLPFPQPRQPAQHQRGKVQDGAKTRRREQPCLRQKVVRRQKRGQVARRDPEQLTHGAARPSGRGNRR